MEFTIKTTKREEIVDITREVKKIVSENTVRDSKMCLVYVPHATCSVIINENYDEAVCRDILKFLKKQIPAGIWEHDKVDNNADAHVKAALLGPSQVIPIENSKLQLGRWQGIAVGEFDGPRERKVIIKIV